MSNRGQEVDAPERPPTVGIIGTRGYPSYYGGFETAVRKIAPYLAGRGWSVTVYGRPGQNKEDDHERDPAVNCVVTRGIDSKTLSTLSYGLTASIRAVTRERPDVALVMNVANGFWLPLLKMRGIPTVVNVDGIEWHRRKWSRLGKSIFRLGAWLTARFADEIIVDARAIGTYWENRLHRSGTFIPYGGEPLPSELPAVPFKSDGYVLLVARFVPENSISEFLAAVPLITREFDVVLVGSAPTGDELYSQVAQMSSTNPRLHWLGHVADDRMLAALWREAAVYFHGHSVGGTNPALVQAMALGAVIVARDTVYNREVLDDAAIFTSVEPEAINASIKAAKSASAMLRDRAQSRATRHYTWDGVCSDYENVLLRSIQCRADSGNPR